MNPQDSLLHTFKQRYLINFWDVGNSMIALGILSAVFFGIFGAVWAVTGEMTRWGGEFLELFGMDLSSYSYYQKQGLDGTPLTRRDGIMLIGMFIGCLIAALMANKVKFRMPASGVRVFQAIVGGILSGYGARLSYGCNLANFFTGLPYFSLHTWVFTLFMILGIWAAVKVCALPYFLPRARMTACTADNRIRVTPAQAHTHFRLGLALTILALVWVIYLFASAGPIDLKAPQTLLGLALVFGLAFGYIISRGQVCFTSCFRDLMLFGRTTSIKGAVFGMAIASLIALAFMLHGAEAKVVAISPGVAIGAFLFGFGIVFAGGCECGWTYRMCEGQVHFFIVGLANFAGTALLALSYDYYPAVIKDGIKINLLQTFGVPAGFAINLLLLLALLLGALLYSHKKLTQGGLQ